MVFWEKKKVPSFNHQLEDVLEEPPLSQRVELLEIEVSSLKATLCEYQRKVQLLEKFIQNFSKENFIKLNENEKVYRLFDEGKEITEIAKDLSKGKGEIELILNLRNLK